MFLYKCNKCGKGGFINMEMKRRPHIIGKCAVSGCDGDVTDESRKPKDKPNEKQEKGPEHTEE